MIDTGPEKSLCSDQVLNLVFLKHYPCVFLFDRQGCEIGFIKRFYKKIVGKLNTKDVEK